MGSSILKNVLIIIQFIFFSNYKTYWLFLTEIEIIRNEYKLITEYYDSENEKNVLWH
jgi:hypothetical protein